MIFEMTSQNKVISKNKLTKKIQRGNKQKIYNCRFNLNKN